MSRKKSRSRARKSLPWWIWVLATLVLWLVASTVMQKSPTQTLTDLYNTITGSAHVYKNPQQQKEEVQIYKDSIQVLADRVAALELKNPYRKAIVNTDANSLNLRAESNIASDVVIKIPDSSVVEVLYFDEEVLVLEGEAGKWCKVKYADKVGWVWGNYVKIID